MEKPSSLLSPKCTKTIPFVRHLKEACKLQGLWEPLMENTVLYLLEMFVTITGGNYNPLSFRISSEDQLRMLLTLRDSICQNVLKWRTVNASSTWKNHPVMKCFISTQEKGEIHESLLNWTVLETHVGAV